MTNNVIKSFFEMAKERGDSPCAHFKNGGEWKIISWFEMAGRVKRLAAYLKRKGIQKGDRIVILAKASLDWTIADYAILACGAICVPIYTSLTKDAAEKIVKDALPVLAFVAEDQRFSLSVRTISFRDVSNLTNFSPLEIADVEKMVDNLSPDDVATYVYTSGTTGEQKGVTLTHGNLYGEIVGAINSFRFSSDDIGLMCLPLAHVLGRMMQFYQLSVGCESAYAESIERLASNYLEVKPHFVCGVPRMLEKVYELAFAKVNEKNGFRKKMFLWAIEIGEKNRVHKNATLIDRLFLLIADTLVLSRIRNALGGRLRVFICGGAALKEHVARFFFATGIHVLEGYGLTETFAAVTANRYDDYKIGTVGKPFLGVEIKIDADHEILVKGPMVFEGYRNRPAETKEAFDSDGWFKTGDLGELTKDGFLRISGRKKDIIVTTGGKNIAPQMVESIMGNSPYIEHFMVYGDGRKYLTALISLNKETALAYLKEKGESLENITSNQSVYHLIEEHVKEQNKKLSSFETIKKFAIIDGNFSVEGGELTPTLKIRRTFTSEKYREVLGKLYET